MFVLMGFLTFIFISLSIIGLFTINFEQFNLAPLFICIPIYLMGVFLIFKLKQSIKKENI